MLKSEVVSKTPEILDKCDQFNTHNIPRVYHIKIAIRLIVSIIKVIPIQTFVNLNLAVFHYVQNAYQIMFRNISNLSLNQN